MSSDATICLEKRTPLWTLIVSAAICNGAWPQVPNLSVHPFSLKQSQVVRSTVLGDASGICSLLPHHPFPVPPEERLDRLDADIVAQN